MRDENKEVVKKDKLTLGERLKDKREREKIELMFYGIFFIAIIVFVRIMNGNTYNVEDNNSSTESFVLSIGDNYQYDIAVTIDDNIYEYYGRILGNNGTINIKDSEGERKYYLMNNKYYVLEDGNYMLTDTLEVYKYIDYNYLSTSQIKHYMKIASREENVYTVKISDILLDSESVDSIVISIDEENKNVVIDYTNLFKLMSNDIDIDKVMVDITYSNIDNIISLDE